MSEGAETTTTANINLQAIFGTNGRTYGHIKSEVVVVIVRHRYRLWEGEWAETVVIGSYLGFLRVFVLTSAHPGLWKRRRSTLIWFPFAILSPLFHWKMLVSRKQRRLPSKSLHFPKKFFRFGYIFMSFVWQKELPHARARPRHCIQDSYISFYNKTEPSLFLKS